MTLIEDVRNLHVEKIIPIFEDENGKVFLTVNLNTNGISFSKTIEITNKEKTQKQTINQAIGLTIEEYTTVIKTIYESSKELLEKWELIEKENLENTQNE